MKEYEVIGAQIEHWDTFFWVKSNFFLVIESALLAVIVTQLNTSLLTINHFQPMIFYLSISVTLFNLFLCYVWFRTNRSNHEYLMVRFNRALQIENDLTLEGVVQLYHFQQDMLSHPGYIKHSSSWWEVHLPLAFMFAWIMSLTATAYDSHLFAYFIFTGLTIASAIGAIVFVERTGWPRPKREKIG